MLTKIVQVFLFPPGLFIVLTAAGFILFILKKRKPAIIILSISLGTVYLFSTGPVADLLLFPLEEHYPPLHVSGTAGIPVVVLGGGAIAASPDEAGRGSMAPNSLKRLVYGIRLRNLTGGLLIVSGGTVYDRQNAEPEAMTAKKLALELGVPENLVIPEVSSRNTWENAVYTGNLLPESDTIILVTSAYHMRRSVQCFRARGFNVIPAPTDYKIDRGGRTVMDNLPSIGSLSGSTAALREYWGILYYRLRYY